MSDAPLRLRYLALLIDVAIVAGLLAIAVSLAAFGKRLRLSVGAWVPRVDLIRFGRDAHPLVLKIGSKTIRAAVGGAIEPFYFSRRTQRAWGSRTVGIRRVDARTGGLVSVRAAFAGRCFDGMSAALVNQLFRSSELRHGDRVRALTPALERIQRDHVDDKVELRDATLRLYESFGCDPLEPLKWMVPRFLIRTSVLWGTRPGRAFRAFATGTRVVIEDRGASQGPTAWGRSERTG